MCQLLPPTAFTSKNCRAKPVFITSPLLRLDIIWKQGCRDFDNSRKVEKSKSALWTIYSSSSTTWRPSPQRNCNSTFAHSKRYALSDSVALLSASLRKQSLTAHHVPHLLVRQQNKFSEITRQVHHVVPNAELAQGSPSLPFSVFTIRCLIEKKEAVEYRERLFEHQARRSYSWSILCQHAKHDGKELDSDPEIKGIQQKTITKWETTEEDSYD